MTLTIWINAFIPKEVPGYTNSIKKGKHAGKTAVPLPGLALIHPLNMLKDLSNWWDTGYLTDQRSFSILPTASVRMQSLVEIELSSPDPRVVRTSHTSSGTTEVDTETGEQLGFAVADMEKCWFSKLQKFAPKQKESPRTTILRTQPGRFPSPRYPIGGTVVNDTTYNIKVHGEAGDPLVWGAANIDYEAVFKVTVHPNRCEVDCIALIDAFPAFEAYALLSGKKVHTLFAAPPPSGNTVTNLPGSANRQAFGFAQLMF